MLLNQIHLARWNWKDRDDKGFRKSTWHHGVRV
jgi:hypothetical protein